MGANNKIRIPLASRNYASKRRRLGELCGRGSPLVQTLTSPVSVQVGQVQLLMYLSIIFKYLYYLAVGHFVSNSIYKWRTCSSLFATFAL